MRGAILGDIIGSPYEFDRGNKTKDFPLFSRESNYTDDSVMTCAIAKAFMKSIDEQADDDQIRKNIIECLKYYGNKYPLAGYGVRFYRWLKQENSQPYNSLGNGSAMRVSSVAWLYDNLEDVEHAAKLSAEVTHNHPEGIKGAQAVASAIYLARTHHSKQEIKEYIESKYQYDLSRTIEQIRPSYYHVETCMESVPEAITGFLEGDSFEDVLRTTISLGGDCDTLGAIAGSIAQAYYGIDPQLSDRCKDYLPDDLYSIVLEFEKRC